MDHEIEKKEAQKEDNMDVEVYYEIEDSETDHTMQDKLRSPRLHKPYPTAIAEEDDPKDGLVPILENKDSGSKKKSQNYDKEEDDDTSSKRLEETIKKDDEKKKITKKFKEDFIEPDEPEKKKKTEETEINHRPKNRQNFSPYDFVKVKVILENQHFYILSRFLISRILTLCKIAYKDAINISRDLKKKLVAENKLEVPQIEMERTLFDFIRAYKYGENYIERYQMMSKYLHYYKEDINLIKFYLRFFQKRIPLIILISGAPCLGKSFIATALAQRMNISNVVQTDLVEMVMKTVENQRIVDSRKLQELEKEEELIPHYLDYTQMIRRGVNTDIQKCLTEGKAVIIEGTGVNMEFYVEKTQNPGVVNEAKSESKAKKLEKLKLYLINELDILGTKSSLHEYNCSHHIEDKFKIILPDPEQEKALNQKEMEKSKKNRRDLEKIDQKSAVIVPIYLISNKKDHLYTIETKRKMERRFDKSYFEALLNKYQKLQLYLLKNAELCTVVPININNLEETLSTLHDIILDKIEAAYKRNDFE